jgi:hypothetical protein
MDSMDAKEEGFLCETCAVFGLPVEGGGCRCEEQQSLPLVKIIRNRKMRRRGAVAQGAVRGIIAVSIGERTAVQFDWTRRQGTACLSLI